MKKITESIKSLPKMRLRDFVGGICFLFLSSLAIVSHLDIQDRILSEIESKSFFWFRALVAPNKLDERIKIFSIDDRFVAQAKTFSPNLSYWSSIFLAFEKAGVASIVVDKFFDNPEFDQTEIDAFNEAMSQIKIPIIIAGFGSTWDIPLRPKIESNWKPTVEYDINKIQYFYGPNPKLTPTLKHVGHVLYEKSGFIWSTLKNKEGSYLPHVSTYFASIIDARPPPQNVMFVDFVNRKTLFERTYSLLPVIDLAKKNEPIPVVKPGDHILILPAMFTGNTDWKDSPIGRIEGGYILASAINSVLKSQWLKIVNNSVLFVFFASLIAFLCNRFSLQKSLWIMLSISSIYLIFVHGAFAYGGLMLPFVVPASAFFSSYFSIAIVRMQSQSIKEARMKDELNTAKIVQSSFFYPNDVSKLKVTVSRKSMEECCGDWWLHYTMPNGIEMFCIADATGHGAPASLVTAIAYSSFYSACLYLDAPANEMPHLVASHLNKVLCSTKGDGLTSMTGTIISYDPESESLYICNAGHLWPILVSTTTYDTLRVPSNPLGISADYSYSSIQRTVTSGSRLILMTDGIYERVNRKGVALSSARFKRELVKHIYAPTTQLITSSLKFVEDFAQGVPASDDATFVVIER
jgi:hypothetical protein